jgi:two-component system, cell cycle response regulator DivK
MSKGLVLIIEDNKMNLEMAKLLLEDAGYDTIGVEEAITGVDMAKKAQPNLILMDLHLPIMDGYEATRILKRNPETQNIPVVAFTALAMSGDAEKAVRFGCEGVIHKPIEVSQFVSQMEAYLTSNN